MYYDQQYYYCKFITGLFKIPDKTRIYLGQQTSELIIFGISHNRSCNYSLQYRYNEFGCSFSPNVPYIKIVGSDCPYSNNIGETEVYKWLAIVIDGRNAASFDTNKDNILKLCVIGDDHHPIADVQINYTLHKTSK